MIVSFCFVGDNIFRPGVRWDHHLHPLSQATKSFSSKPENLSSKNWKILGKRKSEKSCAGRVANPVEENLGKSGSARSTAVIRFFKMKSHRQIHLQFKNEKSKNSKYIISLLFAKLSTSVMIYFHVLYMVRCCKRR